MKRYSAILVAGLFGLCTFACSSLQTTQKTNSPETLYAKAIENLDDGLYTEAVQQFTDLKTKHPYSKFASLAQLGIGDAHFEQNAYLQAVEAYRQFLKFHPNHAKADYAMFRIGEAYYEQIPGKWWFLPPPSEKDQASTRLAISAIRDMLARFPGSNYVPQAKEFLRNARKTLAEHELYVARFYFDRQKWPAAAHRAEGVLKNYSEVGLNAEALWLASQARQRMGDVEKATQHAKSLAKNFPKTRQADKAKQWLN